VETVVEGIGERRLLLVLDNFEQVLAAADTVARLLAGTSGLKIIVTSRAPLHLSGEQELPVPPLALPESGTDLDLEALLATEAVALFVLRAQTVRPDFALTSANARAIVEICVRLDGLPLAIELAASRVRLLPPEALLARLGHRLDLLQSTAADRTDRQRTLRGAIDWSHDLLDADARALFRRLAVFVGGWDLDDAEAVVPAAGQLPLDLLDGLGALVDHSLVRQDAAAGEPRFGMLETIREYGLEQLDGSGDRDDTERAHATWFLGLSVRLGPSFTAAGEALERAGTEHDNIRAALRWALDHGESELALSASGALWRFWHMRGHLREGQRLSSEALALHGAEAATFGRARALYGLASLSYWMGEYASSRAAYEESLAVARAIGAESSEAETLYALGFLYGIDKDYDAAHAVFLESHAIAVRLGDRLAIANALFGAGFTEWLAGRYEHALEELEQVLPMFEQLGDRFSLINAYGVMGRVLEVLGRVEEGRIFHLRVLEGSLEIGDRSMTAMALGDLASLEAQRGDFELALRLDGAQHLVTERLGGSAPRELVRTVDPEELARAAAVPEADIQRLREEGRRLSDAAVVELAKDGQLPA
jgi:predicted ATPase